MDYNWLLEAGKIAGAVGAIIAVIVMIFKFAVITPLKKFIEEIVTHATYPIQKGSNGGFSLADANKKLNALDTRINTIEANQNQMLELLTKPKPGRPPKQTK